MGWNYRIVKHDGTPGGDWYGLHAVYYMDGGQGEVRGVAEDPDAVGNSVEDLIGSVRLMLKDAESGSPVLRSVGKGKRLRWEEIQEAPDDHA